MNKIVLALATVATLGLSTAAFAQSPKASTQIHVQHVQSLAPGAHKMHASHPTGAKKVVVAARHGNLRRVTWHPQHFSHAKGKKVAGKHLAAHKTANTKVSS
ncbi:MAG: hypothetical protein ACLQHL_12670 [Candidatus Cybelea sp.]